ncbi:MAG: hypothetical protein LCI00_06010 [Chloroflexi bacterium]|nr:hypothetical protein [Chloroflexota bacterium]MCC6891855.1 hypothetical protein [Anaerolineae bacterium]
MPATLNARPMPQRPANGLLAWEATIGYLRLQYRLDASLTLRAVANGDAIQWNAYAVWGQNTEQVTDKLSMPAALRELWALIDRKHVIFESREAMLRRPSNYGDDEWLDGVTRTVFNQMIELFQIACAPTWALTIIYEPVEIADVRFQTRLTSDRDSMDMLGQGATLQAACRDLLRVTAQMHIQRRKRQTSENAVQQSS